MKDINKILIICFLVLSIILSITTFIMKINIIIPYSTLIILYIICLLRILLKKQYINVFPHKCEQILFNNNSFYFLSMKNDKYKLDDPRFKNWCNKLKLSGPNILGIYNNNKTLTSQELTNQLTIFKNSFGYNCQYYRSDVGLSNNIQNYLKNKNIIVVNNTFLDLFTEVTYC